MGKISRNELCICGSGKKYKKCCLSKVIPFSQPCIIAEGRKLIKTSTNEYLMPVRLYYTAEKPKQFIEQLSKLQCVNDIGDGGCIINYEHETKEIGLEIACNEVPKELYPIMLACCTLKEKEILVDLKSFKRAALIINFIDQIISRDVASFDYIATYNRLIFSSSIENAMKFVSPENYDNIFSNEQIIVKVPQEVDTLLIDKEASRLLTDFPKVEKFSAYFYTDGMERIEALLNFRLSIASAIGMGHRGTMFDVISDAIKQFKIEQALKSCDYQ